MEGAGRIVYFSVGGRLDVAHLHPDARQSDVTELFRTAGGAGPGDVIKLYSNEGELLNAAPDLPPNTPSTPYTLHVVATPCNGNKLNRLGIDLMDLEHRLCEVERSVSALRADLPPVVEELRRAVDAFKVKLETAEHLSWLGFYKEGLGDGVGGRGESHPYWKHVHYRRTAEQEVAAVVSRFRQICDGVVEAETQELLRLPSFNNWAWEESEILLLLQHMYTDLGLLSKFSIEIEVLRNFLCRVYHCYNQVPFHNFQHAFCVTQMMYGMVWRCGLQERLGDLDVLILLTSCICHDLDHPGFNNIYQINAKTELALRYNDISPLENHHCSVAFTVLEQHECNIFRNVSAEDYKKIREGMIRCILATDMARHNEILSDFKEIIEEFDFKNRAHVNLLSMVLIKVADISNEARPLDIAEPWLECLMQEFFNQSDLEKLEGLPVSPFMDRDKVTKPSSQCSFIGFVLLPLFEALGKVLPELEELIIQPVRFALDHYRKLNEASKKASEESEPTPVLEAEVEEEVEEVVERPISRLSQDTCKRAVQKTESSYSIGSRASSRTSMIRSLTIDCTDMEMDDVDVTETEVDVSERTSRFKIATDGYKSPSRRNSSERRSSVGGYRSPLRRNSSERRTVSPKSLEDRLLPHAEAQESEALREKCEKEVEKESEKETSLFSRLRIFSERLSSSDREKSVNGSAPMGKGSTRFKQGGGGGGLQGVLKRTRSKSEPTKFRTHRTFHISRPRISFGMNLQKQKSDENIINECGKETEKVKQKSSENIINDCDRETEKKCKEARTSDERLSALEIKTSTSCELIEPKKKLSSVLTDAQPSPTLSEKCSMPASNSVLQHKSYSLSLDRLPNKNGKRKAGVTEPQTPENTPGSSEDNLGVPNKNGRSRKMGQTQMLENTPGSSEDNLLSDHRTQSDGSARQLQSPPVLNQVRSAGFRPFEKFPLTCHDSPKNTKKKPESARTLLLKSFSFRKKSPTKDETLVLREPTSHSQGEERL